MKVETRPAHVEDWIDTLPYANFEKTAQLLEEALRDTNREQIKLATRLQLLSIYWRPYRYLLQTYLKGESSVGLRGVDAVQQRVGGLKRVAFELAFGCKITIEEALTRKSVVFANKLPVDTMLLAIKLLGHVLILNYNEYAPTPKNVWRELHTLMQRAEELGVATLDLPDIESERHATTSIMRIYLKLLASSLADPHHLTTGAIWSIYDQLEAWADAIRIGPFREVKNPAGYFVIDLQSSEPPLSYVKFDKSKLGPQHRLLDCAPLQNVVKMHLDQAAAPAPAGVVRPQPPLAPALLAHLQRAWGLPPKRYFPRHEKKGTARIACGMNAAYYFTNHQHEFGVDKPGRASDEELGDESYTSSYTEEVAPKYVADTWHFVNEGPGGYAIYISEKPRAPIRVGEIVALHEQATDNDARWLLGVIRWLMIQRDRSHKIGIQVVAREPEPAAIRVLGGEATEEPRRGFFIKSATGSSAPTVVTSRGLFNQNRAIEVSFGAQRLQLRAGDLIESAAGFDHFSCS